MKKNKQEQKQKEVQIQNQFMDNAFHRLIECFEMLEYYYQQTSTSEKNEKEIKLTTNINNQSNSYDRTLKELLMAPQIQILAICRQSKFKDAEGNFKLDRNLCKYFLEDLLKWYSYRSGCEPTYIERYAIPALASFTQEDVEMQDILSVTDKYIGEIDKPLSEKTDEEKEKAVIEGIKAFMQASEKVKEEIRKMTIDDSFEVTLRCHNRGNITDGYNHLMSSFDKLFPDDESPIALLNSAIKEFNLEIDTDESDKTDQSNDNTNESSDDTEESGDK